MVPQSGGEARRVFPMSTMEGREKCGNGRGVNWFTPRRSAIKAAFEEDLGRRKTDVLSGLGGASKSKLSRWRAFSREMVFGADFRT
jgi:hypothetical protein